MGQQELASDQAVREPGASRKSPVYHFEYTLTMRFRERVNQIVSHGGVRQV